MRNPKRISKLLVKKRGIHINKQTIVVVVVLLLGCMEEKSQQNSDNITGGNMTEVLIKMDNAKTLSGMPSGNMTKDLVQMDNKAVRASWVQDANYSESTKLMIQNEARTGPRGSRYLIGPSKNKRMEDVGIYFYDPTATN